MIELKLECYSCGYARTIGEREFIEDLQQCPSCGSDNIEIVPTRDETQERLIDPSERERIIRRRFMIIGVFGIMFLLGGFLLLGLGGYIFPLMIALWVIGVILILIAWFWWTTPS